MSTRVFGPDVNRAFIYGIKPDPLSTGEIPDFPPEGRQIYPDETFPGIITETAFGAWKAVLVEYKRPVPGPKHSNQKVLFSSEIDESGRAASIRRQREEQPGDIF